MISKNLQKKELKWYGTSVVLKVDLSMLKNIIIEILSPVYTVLVLQYLITKNYVLKFFGKVNFSNSPAGFEHMTKLVVNRLQHCATM